MATAPPINRAIWSCNCLNITPKPSPRRQHYSLYKQRARRNMSTDKTTNSVPHELRTATEPRQDSLYSVRLSKVAQVNPTMRLLQLALPFDKSARRSSEV